MNTRIIFAVIISLLVGFVAGGYFHNDTEQTGVHQMPDGSMMHNEMSNMMSGLTGKSGDEFDKAFLAEMIVHHEGAVDMAEAALVNAKHQEIKTLSQGIISAQTLEIAQMKAWLKGWYNIY